VPPAVALLNHISSDRVQRSSVGCSLANWKDIRPWRPNFGPEVKPSAEWLRRNSESSFYFCPQNRIPVIFSFAEDSERNFGSSFYFCSTERNSELFSLPRKGSEQNSESFLFCGTAGIPSEITICSGYSIFHGIIFFSEIPDPSSESSWYPSGELWTVFGMAAYTLSDETIKFFLVRCHVNILTGDESEG